MMRILAFAAALLFLGLAGCTTPDDEPTDHDDADHAGQDSCDDVTRASLTLADATAPVVAMATSKGCIVAELNAAKAPITVSNFLNYTDEGFYQGLLIHRIIEDFMIQTGGMQEDGTMKTPNHPAIKNEARTSGLKNEKYTLAMARTGQPDSATNQFFINHAANAFLDPSGTSASGAGYAVFGSVVQGREVVDAIAAVPVQHHRQGETKCQGPESSPSCPIDEVHLYAVNRVA